MDPGAKAKGVGSDYFSVLGERDTRARREDCSLTHTGETQNIDETAVVGWLGAHELKRNAHVFFVTKYYHSSYN